MIISPMYLVFDIGGTNMRIAVSSDGKSITRSKIVPTPKEFEDGIQTIRQIADELRGTEKIDAVAGGIAGPLDPNKLKLIKSPHVSNWVDKPLKAELEKLFNCPIYLENDTALVGLGEATSGAGVGKSIAAYITVSTGVGGVRIVDGKIDRNSLGFEPGHQVILPNGAPCNCGGIGHLETLVGGFYLERTYRQKPAEIKDPKVWNEVARYLGLGLCNTIVHWSPDIVILGGAVMKSVDSQKVNIFLKEYLTIFPQPPEIVLAKFDADGGLYGALKLIDSQK